MEVFFIELWTSSIELLFIVHYRVLKKSIAGVSCYSYKMNLPQIWNIFFLVMNKFSKIKKSNFLENGSSDLDG